MESSDKMTPESPVKIDLKSVIDSRLGRKARLLPASLIRRLERLIHQDEMNRMLEYAFPERGGKFCQKILEYLDISVNVHGIENMPSADDTHIIVVSNHPLGGLDGMVLIKFISEYFGKEPLFIINDLLMAVEPLRGVFVPVNKHGAQSRETIVEIDRAMSGDRPVIIFPAGLCSRRKGSTVRDLQWQKMFVQKARQHGRDIVPIRFNAVNSDNFYNWASRRERLGIKFNVEMILLPDEIFKAKGSTLSLSIGKLIKSASLSNDYPGETLRIRRIVDDMASCK